MGPIEGDTSSLDHSSHVATAQADAFVEQGLQCCRPHLLGAQSHVLHLRAGVPQVLGPGHEARSVRSAQ